ncbi:MAG: mycothiol system anti-sigma-R factor [Armatimonadota bacterium]|nr:mycothiol system anti-sigma-R factor [Armatimonadota bacterium]
MSEIDCNCVLQRLWAYLDGEADDTECAELEEHIARCLECRHQIDFEQRLRRIIQIKCHEEPAPATLREGLHRLLSKSP